MVYSGYKKGEKNMKKGIIDENVFIDNMTAEDLDNLYKDSIIVITITEDIIKSKNTKYLTNYYDAILDSKYGRTNKYVITTNAYDNDEREVYQIPEYVDYIKSVFNKVPALFSLLEIEQLSWIIIIYSQTKLNIIDNIFNKDVPCSENLVRKFALNVCRAMLKDNRFSNEDIWTFKERFKKSFGIDL